MYSDDTIAAISSAVGAAARLIVRLCGSDSLSIAAMLGVPTDIPSSTFRRARIRFSDLLVPAHVYVFRSPRSYTGEDLVEFHLPGNPVLAKMLLADLLSRGVRSSEPGEFTARAYFNGKLDLTGAEGVAATIAANSQQQLTAARQLLSGELARRLAPITESLTHTLALLEVGIDFSEEDVSFISWPDVRTHVETADRDLSNLLSHSARFERLAHEPQVVLVGRPNAGKSTLLNALAGQERAVVSAIAGTTRDVLSAEVMLPRGKVRLIDVAGLDRALVGSEIESKMQARALQVIETADGVLLVQEAGDDRPAPVLPIPPSLLVRTKIDLGPARALSPPRGTPGEGGGEGHGEVLVSAITSDGLDELRHRLDQLSFGPTATASTLVLNLRHVQAIEESRQALARVREQLAAPSIELIALELREAIDCLGTILGRLTPDDLLGRIFSGFCIGK